ncbi:MAG: hypothetical protein ACLQJR_14875 [Stellaceae bacterium]
MKTKTVAIGLAGAILLLGAGAPGADFLAQGWMAHQVDAWLAGPPFTKASHGALRYALWRGRLEIDDLAVESASPALRSLHAARVELDGVGPRFLFGGGGDLRLAALRARQVELARADSQESAATLSLTGINVADGAEPAAIPTVVEALGRLSIDRLELGGAHLRTDAGGRDDTFASVAIEHLDKGRCTSLTATELVLVNVGAFGPGLVRTEMAEFHAAGFDLLALPGIAGSAQDEKPVLVDSMSASGLTVAIADATVSAGGVSLTGLQLPPGGLPLRRSQPGSALGAATLDRLEISDLAIAARAQDARVTVGHLALDKLQPGRLGGLAVETVAVRSPRGVGHLGSLELAGLAYDSDVVLFGLPRLFFNRLHLADVSAGQKPGAEIGIKEAEFVLAAGLDDPRGGRFKIGPILVPATLAPLLTAAGYNELVLDYEGSTQYDAAEGVIEASQRLTAHDAGALALSLRLDHYPAALDARDAAAASARYLQAELVHLELRYDDASLIDRLLKFYAARTGGDVEHARQQLLGVIEAQRGAFAGEPELLASLDAIAGFLRQPRSLTLVLAPPKPVPLGTLMQLARATPDQALTLLGLSLR